MSGLTIHIGIERKITGGQISYNIAMKNNKSVKNKALSLSQEEVFLKKFSCIHSQTFKKILESRVVALKYAKIGLEEKDPENLTPDNIEKVADILESVARIILKKREGKSSQKKITKH
ncbi:hypothetical protein GYA49_00255 [Candidatus Beckwithbacteria bacterium]|nr:hypothetical protein [Candidatus Beckwithbacteria bacterium]